MKMLLSLKVQLKSRKSMNITIVGEDVDLVVLLMAITPVNTDIYFLKPRLGKVNGKIFFFKKLQVQFKNVKSWILISHAFSICDPANSMFGKGKKKIPNLSQIVGILNYVA